MEGSAAGIGTGSAAAGDGGGDGLAQGGEMMGQSGLQDPGQMAQMFEGFTQSQEEMRQQMQEVQQFLAQNGLGEGVHDFPEQDASNGFDATGLDAGSDPGDAGSGMRARNDGAARRAHASARGLATGCASPWCAGRNARVYGESRAVEGACW